MSSAYGVPTVASSGSRPRRACHPSAKVRANIAQVEAPLPGLRLSSAPITAAISSLPISSHASSAFVPAAEHHSTGTIDRKRKGRDTSPPISPTRQRFLSALPSLQTRGIRNLAANVARAPQIEGTLQAPLPAPLNTPALLLHGHNVDRIRLNPRLLLPRAPPSPYNTASLRVNNSNYACAYRRPALSACFPEVVIMGRGYASSYLARTGVASGALVYTLHEALPRTAALLARKQTELYKRRPHCPLFDDYWRRMVILLGYRVQQEFDSVYRGVGWPGNRLQPSFRDREGWSKQKEREEGEEHRSLGEEFYCKESKLLPW